MFNGKVYSNMAGGRIYSRKYGLIYDAWIVAPPDRSRNPDGQRRYVWLVTKYEFSQANFGRTNLFHIFVIYATSTCA